MSKCEVYHVDEKIEGFAVGDLDESEKVPFKWTERFQKISILKIVKFIDKDILQV